MSIKGVIVYGLSSLVILLALFTRCAAAEGPIDSLQCISRGVYWESRGEPFETKVQIAEYLIDISRSGRPGIHNACDAVRLVSQGYQTHVKDTPTGQAWEESQAAAITAWQNPKLDHSDGAGAYFIDIGRLTRPGFKTVFVEQVGTVLFFKEVQLQEASKR